MISAFIVLWTCCLCSFNTSTMLTPWSRGSEIESVLGIIFDLYNPRQIPLFPVDLLDFSNFILPQSSNWNGWLEKPNRIKVWTCQPGIRNHKSVYLFGKPNGSLGVCCRRPNGIKWMILSRIYVTESIKSECWSETTLIGAYFSVCTSIISHVKPSHGY